MVSRGATLTLGVWGAVALAMVAEVAVAGPIAGPVAGPFERQLRQAEARLRALFGRPEAVAPLSVVAGLAEDLPPRMIEDALRPVVAGDPLVAAQAAQMLARLEEQRGDVAGAERRRAALGLFRHFWVVGPFGDGRASFSQPFPPELETGAPDVARRYPGKEREVAWRRGDDAVRAGALLLDGLLRPDTQAVAYVMAFVSSDAARDAALRLGSAGPIKVWVNGTPVFSRDVVRAPAMDQDAAAIRLARGWNRVLIKTVITDGPWRIYARVTDLRGRPLAVSNDHLPSGEAPVAVGGRGARLPFRSPDRLRPPASRRCCVRAHERQPGAAGAGAWLDLGRYLAWSGVTDRQAREEVAALEESVKRRPGALALAMLADVAREDDERRQALERLLALIEKDNSADARSARCLALAKLGEIARGGNREGVATEHWRQALGVDPLCWPAAVALSSEELDAGLPRRALDRLGALPEAVREVPRVTRLWARVLEAVDRREEADALLARLDRSRQVDGEVAHQLAGRARARGDAVAAIHYLRRAAELRPDLPSLALEAGARP